MILGTINGDGDIWCRRVFRPVPMPGSKGRTELFPVGFHECSELVFGQVFRRIEKVERILPTPMALELMKEYSRVERKTFEEWEGVKDEG